MSETQEAHLIQEKKTEVPQVQPGQDARARVSLETTAVRYHGGHNWLLLSGLIGSFPATFAMIRSGQHLPWGCPMPGSWARFLNAGATRQDLCCRAAGRPSGPSNETLSVGMPGALRCGSLPSGAYSRTWMRANGSGPLPRDRLALLRIKLHSEADYRQIAPGNRKTVTRYVAQPCQMHPVTSYCHSKHDPSRKTSFHQAAKVRIKLVI
jgi:hypothetical protein